MLEIDDADYFARGLNGDGQHRFEEVLRKVAQNLEARIPQRSGGNGYGLAVFGHPSGDPLAKREHQLIDEISVRIARSAQNQPILFERIDEAGIAGNDGRDEFDDAIEYAVKRVGGGHTAADFVEELDAVGQACFSGTPNAEVAGVERARKTDARRAVWQSRRRTRKCHERMIGFFSLDQIADPLRTLLEQACDLRVRGFEVRSQPVPAQFF